MKIMVEVDVHQMPYNLSYGSLAQEPHESYLDTLIAGGMEKWAALERLLRLEQVSWALVRTLQQDYSLGFRAPEALRPEEVSERADVLDYKNATADLSDAERDACLNQAFMVLSGAMAEPEGWPELED